MVEEKEELYWVKVTGAPTSCKGVMPTFILVYLVPIRHIILPRKHAEEI